MDAETLPSLARKSTAPGGANAAIYWSAQAISQIGDEVYALAVPLIAYGITGSAIVMTALYALSLLPHLVFGVLGGAWTDRHGTKPLIISFSLGAAAVLCVLAAAISGHWHRLPVLFVGVTVLSVLGSALLAAYDGALNSAVAPERRIKVISSLESTRTITVILGPVIAGVLVSLWNGSFPLLVDALSFVVAGLLVTMIRFADAATPAEPSNYRDLLDSVREGLIHLWRTGKLRYGVALSTMNNIALGGFEVLVVFRLRQSLGASSAVTGLVFASGGLAAFLTSLVVRRIAARLGLLSGMGLGLAGIGAAGLLLAAAPTTWLVALAQALNITFGLVFNVCWRTYRQNHCESSMIGRVSGACRGIAYCGATIGSGLCAASLAVGLPATDYLYVGGVIVLALALLSRRLFRETGQI